MIHDQYMSMVLKTHLNSDFNVKWLRVWYILGVKIVTTGQFRTLAMFTELAKPIKSQDLKSPTKESIELISTTMNRLMIAGSASKMPDFVGRGKYQ